MDEKLILRMEEIVKSTVISPLSCAKARALISAFSSNVAPVSSISESIPSSRGETHSISGRIARISLIL